jgi:hypothetical protein
MSRLLSRQNGANESSVGLLPSPFTAITGLTGSPAAGAANCFTRALEWRTYERETTIAPPNPTIRLKRQRQRIVDTVTTQ